MRNFLVVFLILMLAASVSATETYDDTRVWAPEVKASVSLVSDLLKVEIDPALILSMIHQESRGDHRAHSSAGAFGLMQLTPGTARYLASLLGCTVRELRSDPSLNILGGVLYFGILKKRYGSDRDALIAYNAGEANLLSGRFKQLAETVHYLRVILSRQKHFKSS